MLKLVTEDHGVKMTASSSRAKQALVCLPAPRSQQGLLFLENILQVITEAFSGSQFQFSNT